MPESAETGAGFIVRFASAHALGRAHGLQGAGRYGEAEDLVRATLREDVALRGLCFDRFTLGGAEMVLNVCAAAPAPDRTPAARRLWLDRLTAMRGADYAEFNLVAYNAPAFETGS